MQQIFATREPKVFATRAESLEFMAHEVDRPAPERDILLENGVRFRSWSMDLGGDAFTNGYDLSFRSDEVMADIQTHRELTSPYDVALQGGFQVTTGAGFLYLVDVAEGLPRQKCLNLAVNQGQAQTLPVLDREAVICQNGRLEYADVQAYGVLELNGVELTWAGSRTQHLADVFVYGTANIAIEPKPHPTQVGHLRVLDESSRYTPAMSEADGLVDIGLIAMPDGTFQGCASSRVGSLDIFACDLVVRCAGKYAAEVNRMRVRTIGPLQLGNGLSGAVSVGPSLLEPNFEQHPTNFDGSLCVGTFPLNERRCARTVLYLAQDGLMHLRMWDGRPRSDSFTGVTPREAVNLVEQEDRIVWGCFLDSGQTCKFCVHEDGEVGSYGSRHYLLWPEHSGRPGYIWRAKHGRPVSSTISLLSRAALPR